MHPPSSTLWRLTKLHLHWEHRGNVFKIAPATTVQQRSKTLKDVTKFLSPAIATWYLTDLCYLSTLLVLVMASTYSNTKENIVRWNCSHLRLGFLGSSLVFSISVDSYLDHWQSCASSCRGPLGAAGNTDEELHQGRKANTISLIDSCNALKLISVFIGFESNSLLSLLVILT